MLTESCQIVMRYTWQILDSFDTRERKASLTPKSSSIFSFSASHDLGFSLSLSLSLSLWCPSCSNFLSHGCSNQRLPWRKVELYCVVLFLVSTRSQKGLEGQSKRIGGTKGKMLRNEECLAPFAQSDQDVFCSLVKMCIYVNVTDVTLESMDD